MNNAPLTPQDSKRVAVTIGVSLRRFCIAAALAFISAYLTKAVYERHGELLTVGFCAVQCIFWAGKAIAAASEYQRIARGEVVLEFRASNRARFGSWLVIGTVCLVMGLCVDIARVINHPHSSHAWQALGVVACLWIFLGWGWRRFIHDRMAGG
ncbi:hypothetical protein CCAX7_28150 [Capsulimonas corticalis]|uniref:Uncharacterized protein n=1 Tax=Capsulimonas corticalis TaxID=2219043 RepID=A0A402CTE7_9BACT|nr:hypothetical protein [Capsulimonas corticalis]BDI30764.1 hypothetical protein CCAX7_28150 [Capsulimonas corticalis]